MIEDVVRTLSGARALVLAGWTQRMGKEDEDGQRPERTGKPPVRYCLLEAVYESRPPFSDRPVDEVIFLTRAAGLDTEGLFVDVLIRLRDWQDQPGRTQAEVLDVIDRGVAIAMERVSA